MTGLTGWGLPKEAWRLLSNSVHAEPRKPFNDVRHPRVTANSLGTTGRRMTQEVVSLGGDGAFERRHKSDEGPFLLEKTEEKKSQKGQCGEKVASTWLTEQSRLGASPAAPLHSQVTLLLFKHSHGSLTSGTCMPKHFPHM